ncbi:MAG TPA: choice-of-anchor tandem repeat GloVer-containing protein, partial [Candidatus Tumulicola sp.]|nr:choice-of-anchor tandem repeat GloVer-containing protein [Candidatus Tumulicola sp.]
MKTALRFAFGIGAAAAVLAGCGGGGIGSLNPSPPQHAPAQRHPGVAYAVIHSFGSGSDGVNPQAGLIKVKGVLYGTTQYGGANGLGTVFSLTPSPSSTETTLYSFAGYPSDGSDPVASLVNVNGTFYGTTLEGGGGNCGIRLGCGTAFAIAPSGAETVLHTFGQDATNPEGGLIYVKGSLYGTTASGGTNTVGTVFAIPRFGY